MSSFAGGQVPILLPGKLQWVRNKHIQLETVKKLRKSSSVALSSHGISILPSERFFGKYEEHVLDIPTSKASIRSMLDPNDIPPAAVDGLYSYTTVKARERHEARARVDYHVLNFDRLYHSFSAG